jgi:hypothetical protein
MSLTVLLVAWLLLAPLLAVVLGRCIAFGARDDVTVEPPVRQAPARDDDARHAA